jgi:Cu/Ag efflux protein CusF
MRLPTIALAGATIVSLILSAAFAQENQAGTITKVDGKSGIITIQLTQSGTVGASTSGAPEEYKVRDGLLFNALKPGDHVVFSASDVNGAKTITSLQQQ